jgi:electron transfer flavoprotein beta subunit
MKIGVCVKLVPPQDVRISIDGEGDGSTISPSVYKKLGLNTYDDFALEEAVQQKAKIGADKVIVFSVDNRKKADSNLRNALAKGGDELILVADAALEHADSYTIAKVLSEAIKQEEIDILFCGKLSTDGENSQVPAMISEFLGWSSATNIRKIEFEDNKYKAWRDISGGNQAVVVGSTPVVVSCDKGINEPRFVKLKERMASKKKPFKKLSLSDLDLDNTDALVTESSWFLPASRSECKFIEGSNEEMVQELVHLLRTESKVL